MGGKNIVVTFFSNSDCHFEKGLVFHNSLIVKILFSLVQVLCSSLLSVWFVWVPIACSFLIAEFNLYRN